jgi:hypothetical protein
MNGSLKSGYSQVNTHAIDMDGSVISKFTKKLLWKLEQFTMRAGVHTNHLSLSCRKATRCSLFGSITQPSLPVNAAEWIKLKASNFAESAADFGFRSRTDACLPERLNGQHYKSSSAYNALPS